MKINLANIKKARNLLNKRECVAIPTETVYGIAGNAYSDTACKKIFRLKKRPMNNPLIIHYYDLKKLSGGAKSNTTWMNALSSVNGIYLIRDKSSGKLYVGSAYGEDGIYGRWLHYAHSGDGGNKELKGLDPNQFEFSILEIIPPTSSPEEVIHRENRWKEKLGTRVFGLNAN